MKKKPSEIGVKDRKRKIIDQLQGLGVNLYSQMESGEFPSLRMPSRSTQNIRYDPYMRQFVLGDSTVRRSARNIRHLRPFTQLVWVADFAKHLTAQKRTSTLRDVFYNAQAYEISFKDQPESDNIITDLETVLGYAREDFNVFPEERSAIFGNLTIEYTVPGYEGRRLNLTSHPDGMMIGPALTSAEFIETDAEILIAIEKGAMFTRFIEEKAHQKFKAILIHTAGQAPRATRHMIWRLNQEVGLPVYIFTDADPWGIHIAMVIISGSANAAHIRELTTPDARWSGLWASDIVKYNLPSDRLNNIDLKRLQELQKDPRYEGKLWKREIDTFFKIQKKAEQEAFSRYGLSFIVDKYLPSRLEEMKSY